MGWRRVAGVAKPGGCVVAAVAASPLGGRKLEPPPPPCPPSPPPLVLRAPFLHDRARSGCLLGLDALAGRRSGGGRAARARAAAGGQRRRLKNGATPAAGNVPPLQATPTRPPPAQRARARRRRQGVHVCCRAVSIPAASPHGHFDPRLPSLSSCSPPLPRLSVHLTSLPHLFSTARRSTITTAVFTPFLSPAPFARRHGRYRRLPARPPLLCPIASGSVGGSVSGQPRVGRDGGRPHTHPPAGAVPQRVGGGVREGVDGDG